LVKQVDEIADAAEEAERVQIENPGDTTFRAGDEMQDERGEQERQQRQQSGAKSEGLSHGGRQSEAGEQADQRGGNDERLRPLVRPAARWEILRSVADGCVPVFATGAFDFLAQPLAVELGVAEVIGTRLEFADGCCRGRIAGPELRGAAKAGAVRAHFEGRGVDWAGSRAFSDDREDAPLLSLVGEPWFVSRGAVPDEGLPAAVRGVDWDVSGTGA